MLREQAEHPVAQGIATSVDGDERTGREALQCGVLGINWPRLEWALHAVCDAGRLGIIGTVLGFCKYLRACKATAR